MIILVSREKETEGQSEGEAEEVVRATGLTAAVLVLFLLLRLLAVSDWNWDTAAEVLETINVDDSISIMFGTLFAEPWVTGIIIAVLLPLAVSDLIGLRAESKRSLGQVLLVAALTVSAFAIVKTFGYWWMPVGIVAIGAVIAFHELLKRQGRSRDMVLVAVGRVGTVALIALLALAAFVRTPWTPEERIVTKFGDIVGYVLDTEPGYLKVLTSEGREMVIVVSSDVESRTSLD